MNRRGFLDRLAAVAAAVVGLGALAPKAVAASETMPTLLPGQRWAIEAPVDPLPLRMASLAVTSGGTLSNVTLPPGVGVVVDGQNVRIENVTLTPSAPAIAWLRACCWARGCDLSVVNTAQHGEWLVTHRSEPQEAGAISRYFDAEAVRVARIDAWVRALHRAGG